MRNEIEELTDQIVRDVNRFKAAHDEWIKAVNHRDKSIATANKKLLKVTSGLSLKQLEKLQARKRINSISEALAVSKALRTKTKTEQALDELLTIQQDENLLVLIAKRNLAIEASQLLKYQNLTEDMTGVTLPELRKLTKG